MDEFATKLIEGQHYAADDVAQRRAMVSSLLMKLLVFFNELGKKLIIL